LGRALLIGDRQACQRSRRPHLAAEGALPGTFSNELHEFKGAAKRNVANRRERQDDLIKPLLGDRQHEEHLSRIGSPRVSTRLGAAARPTRRTTIRLGKRGRKQCSRSIDPWNAEERRAIVDPQRAWYRLDGDAHGIFKRPAL